VRELLHPLERAVLRCEDNMLKIHHFPELEAPALRRRTWEEAIQGFQRQFLVDTLRTCSYSVAEGTGSLGLARPALYATARRLGVDLVAERLRRSRE